MSRQAGPPPKPTIPAEVEVEIQRHFNELRREVLDDQASHLKRWISFITAGFTALGIFAGIIGYIEFTQIEEFEIKAENQLQKIKSKTEKLFKEIAKLQIEYSEIVKKRDVQTDTDDSENVSTIIATAHSFQQAGKIDEAIEKWREVGNIAKEKNDNALTATAQFSIGSLLFQNKKWKDSISAYDQAIRLNPNFAEAYYNRGAVKSISRLPQEDAIADYDQAIRLNPNFAEAYYNRGNAKFELGQYKDAIADYDQAIHLNPNDAQARSNRSNAKSALELTDDIDDIEY